MHRHELTHDMIVYYAAPTTIRKALENPETANWTVDHPEKRYRRTSTWSQVRESPVGKLVRITRDDREEYVPCSHLLGAYSQIHPIRAKIVQDARDAREQKTRILTEQLAERTKLIAELHTRQITAQPTSDPTTVTITVAQLKDLLWRTQ